MSATTHVLQLSNGLLETIIKLFHFNKDDRVAADVLRTNLAEEIYFYVLSQINISHFHMLTEQESSNKGVMAAIEYIKKHLHEPLTSSQLAKHASMSEASFYNKFKAAVRCTPLQYVKSLKLHEARKLIVNGSSISKAAFSVGYVSPSQFSREFRKIYGVSPSDLK